MGLLRPGERSQFIDILLELPGFDSDPDKHRLLTMNLPNDVVRHIKFAKDALVDIHAILNVVNEVQLEDGSWPVVWVVEEAVRVARGLALAKPLCELRDTLQGRVAAQAPLPAPPDPQQRPAALPHPHLFDTAFGLLRMLSPLRL